MHSPESNFPYLDSKSYDGEKHDGLWQMCIDYSDLNNTCRKNYCPLPEIDKKVEYFDGCFLNAFKGYHQVRWEDEDEDKTTFHIDHDTFCYQRMPFGLKNTGVTYQRLMDKVFANLIGRNVEVYVDHMVIKIHNEVALLRNIIETSETLTKA